MGARSPITPAPPRCIEALAYILDRIQRTGTSPSYGEIGQAMRPSVRQTRVCKYIAQLIGMGLIERPLASRRGIRIRDLARCRQVIEEALGQRGWHHAPPLGPLEPPPCTIEHLAILPLILEDRPAT